MRTILPVLFVSVAGFVFVHTMLRTGPLNAQLRTLGRPPLRNVGPIVAFVLFFAVGFVLGLLLVDFYVLYRNNRARRLIVASAGV